MSCPPLGCPKLSCFDLQEVKKEKLKLVHPRHLWYHYEANLAKSFTLGFSLNEVSQLGISTLKSPLNGIAKAKD